MEDQTDDSTRHRRRRVEDNYLQTLIESITIDQVREALSNLSPDRRIAMRNRSDAFDALLSTRKSVSEITTELLSLEAQAPFRHCFITSLAGDPTAALANAFVGKTIRTDTTEFRVVYAVDNSNWQSITVEHSVPVREWVTSADGKTKTLRELTLRHPIVLRLYAVEDKHRVLIASFPGFSQGGGIKIKERLSYEVVVTELVTSVARSLGIVVRSFPLLRCLNLLAEGESKRVRIVDSNVHSGQAGLTFSSRVQSRSVNDVVNDFLFPHLKAELGERVNEAVFRKAVTEAFRHSTYNSIVALWEREQVVTRIQFWPTGAEFLFIWHGAASSYGLVESILAPLSNISRALEDPTEAGTWSWLTSLAVDHIVTLASVCTELGISKDVAQSALLHAINAGLIEPVYRIKTGELLLEMQNGWTSALSSLSRKFTTANNEEINGCDPQNIEVAFRRVVGGNKQ
ncbi:hypothetical protein [Paraburkholderia sp.]|uniref:hypothetical protein n=1 Tax=Paraburkholderia sp. TaxID=1926495 RepID=UPI003C7B9BA1